MSPIPWLSTEGSAFFSLLFAAGFLCVSLAVGARLLKLCGATTDSTRAERAVMAACLGAGALQFVPFTLGLIGVLNVGVLRVAAVIVALLALPDMLRLARSAAAAVRAWQRPGGWTIAWVLALSPAVLMATLVALAPSLDPDGLAYHLTIPKRWMETGHLDYLPTYPFSSSPLGMEMLFAWALAIAGDSAAKCIHLILGLLAVVAIYLAGKRLRGPMVGAVPATVFLVGPFGVAVVLGFSYVEGATALATAGSALAWLIWYQAGSRGFLRVAALLAGVAVSFKLSAALFPVALGALTLLALHERLREQGAARPLTETFTTTMALIPFLVAPVVPWFIRAFILTGNPFFPLFATIIPTRDLSPELATQIDSYNRYLTWGNSLGREWSLEHRAQLILAVAAVVLLVGVFAFFKLRTRMARGTAVIVTVAMLAQLSAAGLYFRYSLPLAAALMLPIMVPFARMLAWRPVMVAWVAITLACSVVQTRRIYLDEGANLPGVLATVAGIQDRRQFLAERLPLYPLYEMANRDLPKDAGIMLSGYCGGFHIDRTTFCAEMVQTALRFSSWEEFTTDVRRLGITHLIAPSVLATGGPTPDLGGSSVSAITRGAQYRVVRQLLTQHARTLLTASDQGLYEIDPAWLANGEATSAR